MKSAFNLNWGFDIEITRTMTDSDYKNKNIRYIGDDEHTGKCLYENEECQEFYIEK